MTPPLSRAALLSFLLGLASVLLVLLALTGIPALIIGLRALRAINAEDGQLRGRRLAIAGMALGGLGTLLTVVGAACIVFVQLQEKSNRVTSMNNLRQIGQALDKYRVANEHYPPGTLPSLTLPDSRRIGWMADVVPFLGEGTARNETYLELAAKIQRRKAWNDPANEAVVNTVVRPFLCPGHPDFSPTSTPGLSHYIGIAGLGADAPTLDRANRRAGVFGTDRGIKRREALAGISFTVVAVESGHDNGPWLCGIPATVRGVPRKEESLFGVGCPFGGINSGGFHALWLDGSARWLNDSYPVDVFRAQATLVGRE